MLEVLRSIVQEVNSARNLEIALDIIVERVQSAMQTHVCTVYLLDQEHKQYIFMATRGLNQSAVGTVSLDVNQGLVGLVGARAEPVNLDEASQHPRYHYVEEVGEDTFHSFLGVPIIHHRNVLGVLVVQQRDSRKYDDSEEAFLITLSAQLAGVIAHARATGDLVGMSESLPSGSTRFLGKSGAPGIAIGTAVVVYQHADLTNVPDRTITDIDLEIELFNQAVDRTRVELTSLADGLSDRLQKEELDLFEAYLHMLDDSAIGGEVVALIRQGEWSQSALRKVVLEHVNLFERMEDSYLRERGSDVGDLGRRVLSQLQQTEQRRTDYPENTILVGEELTASLLAEVPAERLVGLVSLKGSNNSHVAILARALGIPTVMGAADIPIELVDAKPLIVDGFEGLAITYPSPEQLAFYSAIYEEELALNEELLTLKDEPSVTPDNHRVSLWVNTGLMTDVVRSLARGAEGVGLYRTEVFFMMNDRFPTEEEQRVIYREHLQAFGPRNVTMRTLDIGGDKALPYFPIEEANPFLGWRGIRVSLDHPELFLAQVRAMIKASEGLDAELKIMLPMISSVTEVDDAQRLIAQCYREIIEEGIEVEMPDVGVMIEVPSAVFQARDIIKRVDFLSVGSNDLTQYMLAVDRNNARVGDLYQDFHPAVLRALKMVVDAGKSEKKPVGICGEMAGHPSSALLLMAMGYDVLSMNSTNLLAVKWLIRTVEMSTAKRILAKVLKMDNAWLIKDYVDEQVRAAGLGRLVRSGY